MCILRRMDEVYRFAGAEFDPKSGALSFAGHVASLRPRTAKLLLQLAKRAPELVTKDELLREVWADLVVTDNSLSQCVSEIRRELGEAGETILQTVQRRGFKLAAEVERIAVERSRRGKRLSLMVLPLVNLGGDPEHDYFAEGLTEDLTMDLGRMPEAFVISRGTALAYAERRVDARRIGSELGVRYLVEGSVRRGERDVVVNLNVCDTEDARQVWAERFAAPRGELLDLQRSMAARLAHMLHLDLLTVASDRLAALDGRDLDAHDLAMRAFAIKVRSVPGVSPEAHRLVDHALELDPGCAYAWTVRAECCLVALVTRTFTDWEATAAMAESSARKALELDPQQRTAHCALGGALVMRGRFEEALGSLERQVALVPNFANAHNWMGIAHTMMGNAHLAVRAHEAAVELSPRDPRLSTWIRSIALAWLHQREDGRGLAEAERSVAVPSPWPRSYETLAMAYGVGGLKEEARAAVDVLLRHWPRYSIAQHRAEMISSRPAFVSQRERLLDALREAGLPAS